MKSVICLTLILVSVHESEDSEPLRTRFSFSSLSSLQSGFFLLHGSVLVLHNLSLSFHGCYLAFMLQPFFILCFSLRTGSFRGSSIFSILFSDGKLVIDTVAHRSKVLELLNIMFSCSLCHMTLPVLLERDGFHFLDLIVQPLGLLLMSLDLFLARARLFLQALDFHLLFFAELNETRVGLRWFNNRNGLKRPQPSFFSHPGQVFPLTFFIVHASLLGLYAPPIIITPALLILAPLRFLLTNFLIFLSLLLVFYAITLVLLPSEFLFPATLLCG